MSHLRTSIVVETITAREHHAEDVLADRIAGALDGIDRQSYPRALIERIVVVDEAISASELQLLRERFSEVRFVASRTSNYFDAKNAGAAASTGDIVVLLDGDCVPDDQWLAQLVSQFKPGITAVIGKTRYADSSLAARIFSVTDFANVVAEADGTASGIMLNNVAFRREAIIGNPLDARIPRNGACYILYHQLRAKGARILYAQDAVVAHRPDVGGLGFVRKHFDRGHDGFIIYSLDDRHLFRGSALIHRFGGLALIPLTARRIVLDWIRLSRHRDQIGISVLSLPWYFVVATGVRLIELAGGLTASVRQSSSPKQGKAKASLS
jgi:glycosyltransferase involved in cell wall biosynthesis